ncbi:uncharacterized protein LOC144161799 [Haemaphysalis longicornis]
MAITRLIPPPRRDLTHLQWFPVPYCNIYHDQSGPPGPCGSVGAGLPGRGWIARSPIARQRGERNARNGGAARKSDGDELDNKDKLQVKRKSATPRPVEQGGHESPASRSFKTDAYELHGGRIGGGSRCRGTCSEGEPLQRVVHANPGAASAEPTQPITLVPGGHRTGAELRRWIV